MLKRTPCLKGGIAALAISAMFPPSAAFVRAQSATPGPSGNPGSSAAQPRVEAGLGRVPINFEPNRGQLGQVSQVSQVEAGVDAVARGRGYSLYLRQGEAELMLTANPDPAHLSGAASRQSVSADVRLKLAGANATAQVSDEEELPAKSNYFLGNDPARWRTDIPNYARVRYASVYPGIDLVYYGNGRRLEHDFIVAPGGDPGRIAFSLAGCERVYLDRHSGDIVAATAAGDLRLTRPTTYQVVAGKRVAVASGYQLAANGRIRFHLGAYDPSQALIIDPELSYSTQADYGQLNVDNEGNAYLLSAAPNGSSGVDVWFAKFSPGGSTLLSTTTFGGSGNDSGSAIAFDAWGYAYITGNTQSRDFPTKNAFQSSFQGTGANAQDAFVVKLNQQGNAMVYSTYLGGGGETAMGIAVDARPQAFVMGTTTSAAFPKHLALQPDLKGTSNLYITAFGPTGSTVLYSTYLGGSGANSPSGIAVDPRDNVYVAGTTTSTDFPTRNALQPTPRSPSTGFISKIYPTGSQLVYSTYFGGSGGESISGLGVDSAGNAYVAGITTSVDFPVANAYQSNGGTLLGQPFDCAGGSYTQVINTAFVSKMNPSGSALVYSTYLGQVNDGDNFPGNGFNNDCVVYEPIENGATSLAVDASGDAVVTGYTFSSFFPVTSDAFEPNNAGAANCTTNAFLTKLDPAGDSLIYSTYFGGGGDSGGRPEYCNGVGGATSNAVVLDRLGSAYIFGFPSSANLGFPITEAAYDGYFDENFYSPYLAKFAFATMAHTTTSISAAAAETTGTNTFIFTGTVRPASGGPVPTGSVGFQVDSVWVGEANLNASGVATFQYTFGFQGGHTVRAYYSGRIDTDASVGILTGGFGIANQPGIGPAAGTYHYQPTISMTDRLSGTTIHYTLDGTTPTASSPVYSAPFKLTKSATVKAIAIAANAAGSTVLYANSPVASATYVLPAAAVAPVD